MAFQEVFNVSFASDAAAGTGGAGTTTGGGHGIDDFSGGIISRANGDLVCSSSANLYTGYGIFPGTGIGQDQIAEAGLPANRPAAASPVLLLRGQLISGAFYRGYRCVVDNGGSVYGNNLAIQAINSGNAIVNIASTPFPAGYSDSTAYIVQAEAVGANPTTLTFSLLNATTRAVLATATGQDSTAGLQVPGVAGFSATAFPGTTPPSASTAAISYATIQEQQSPAGIQCLPTVTSTGSSNTLVAAPTGGTAPYAYQWHRKQDSVNWTPSGATLIAGATSATLIDTGIAPNQSWCYRCVITDSSATPQSASSEPVVAVTPLAVSGSPRPLAGGLILIEVGDSWTASGVAAAEHASKLTAAYGITTYLVNEGVSGTFACVDWVVGIDPHGYIASTVSAIATAKAAHAGAKVLASIMLGINDATQNYTASQIATAIVNLANYLLAHGADAVELKCPPYQQAIANLIQGEILAQLRPLLIAAANPTGGIFLGDMTLPAQSSQNPQLYIDTLHENNTGFTAVGDLWATGTRTGYLLQSQIATSISPTSVMLTAFAQQQFTVLDQFGVAIPGSLLTCSTSLVGPTFVNGTYTQGGRTLTASCGGGTVTAKVLGEALITVLPFTGNLSATAWVSQDAPEIAQSSATQLVWSPQSAGSPINLSGHEIALSIYPVCPDTIPAAWSITTANNASNIAVGGNGNSTITVTLTPALTAASGLSIYELWDLTTNQLYFKGAWPVAASHKPAA